MEDFISDMDLNDVQISKRKFTWSNRHPGAGYISVRLDILVIASFILEDDLIHSSLILPWDFLDHRTISLSLYPPKNLGPIPFRFNPLWFQHQDFMDLISLDPWPPHSNPGETSKDNQTKYQGLD